MRKLVAVAAMGVLLVMFAPSAWANGIDGRAWRGVWRIDPGPRIVISEQGGEISGRWDCGCRGGRRAIVRGEIRDRRPNFEIVVGSWRCPERGGPRGVIRFHQVGGTNEFGGWYTVAPSRTRRSVEASLIRR